MNNYTKLLVDLANVEVVIADEDILLSSLPDEDYKIIVLTLINDKQFLSYNVLSALVNYELRRKDEESSNSLSVEVLTVRGKSSSRKGKGDPDRSKSRTDSRDLKKNQCTFYKEIGHLKVDCPRIKGKESKPGTNLT